MLKTVVFLVESFGAAFVFWLGLFICSRSMVFRKTRHDRTELWQNPSLLAGIAITLLALFLFGVAMQTIAQTPQHFLIWQRLTWWAVPVTMYGFCWAIISLYYRQQVTGKMWRRLLVLSWLLAVIALLLVIAILTGILVQGEQIEAVQSSFASYRTLPRIPWYLFYAAYLFGTLTSTLAILLVQNLRIVRDSPREYQKVKWLLVGSGVSLLGMTIAVVIQPLAKGFVPVQLGMFGIITGVGIIGYGIVNHNTMMREQVLKQDFQHSLLIDTLLARATEEATKQPTATPVATAPAQSSQHSTAVERNSGEPSFSQSRVFLPLISSTENQVGSVQGKTDESVQSAATTAVYKAYLPLIVSPHIVDFTKLQRGDLLFRMGKTGDFTLTNYAMIFSQNAFYDGNLKTYESNIDIGGVRRLALSTWQLPVFTALVRATGKNKNGVSLTSTVVQGALDWAENKWGFTSTGYNIWITDKNTDARLYCSQLAWKTFGYIQTEVNSESQLVEDFLINKFG